MKERIKGYFRSVLGLSRRDSPDIAKLKAITAAQIPLADASEVEIRDVMCGNETISWRATYRKRHFRGHADGLFLRVILTRVG